MVTAESLSSVSEQMTSEHRPSGQPAGSSGVAGRASAATRRIRSSIGDPDRTTCRTRLSQRQFMIQLQADVVSDLQGKLERFQGSTMSRLWSGKVVDWD